MRVIYCECARNVHTRDPTTTGGHTRNTYKIIFTRENGTQGTDHFTAINERQARKDFGECYRHSTATIISIELASTNTPATKQQERDTLEKIRKMVEQLGPDSYLATTFEGCFDLAAENIDNDWACSMADRARNAEKRVAELEDKLSEAVKDYEAAHAAAHRSPRKRTPRLQS